MSELQWLRETHRTLRENFSKGSYMLVDFEGRVPKYVVDFCEQLTAEPVALSEHELSEIAERLSR